MVESLRSETVHPPAVPRMRIFQFRDNFGSIQGCWTNGFNCRLSGQNRGPLKRKIPELAPGFIYFLGFVCLLSFLAAGGGLLIMGGFCSAEGNFAGLNCLSISSICISIRKVENMS